MTSRTTARFALPLVLVTLVAAQVVSRLLLHAQPPATGATEFVAHEIGTGLRGGYQVVIADLNKDGKPDIITVQFQGTADVAWYENPGWQRHVIAAGQTSPINAAVYDVDGDGIPELALAQGFATTTKASTGIISLLTHGADPTQPWTTREIDRVTTAHRLRWVDADGSGKKMLAVAPLIGPEALEPDYKSPTGLYFYRAPDWKRETITDTFTGLVHGLQPVPWEGVKGEALLSAGFMGIYLHRFANGKWTPTEVTKGDPQPWPKSGSSDIALGKLGAQKFIAAIEPWHGNEVVVYTLAGVGWQRKPIGEITDGHSIVTLDIDNDGRDEVIAGQRGGARSLMLYSASPDGASWSERVLDHGGMAGSGCAAADLNADRRVDIVCIGSATANLKWYENVGKK